MDEKPKIEIRSDGYRVSGPRRTDKSYTVSFEFGEYQQVEVAKLMTIPTDAIMKITIELE